MTSGARKPRLAVVSPSLDKRHGTERLVVEWISRLAPAFEIHIYSQRVADVDPSVATWHRIPEIPGPHILNYLWWFAANRLWRAWDSRFRNLACDLVYSPGINCPDAEVMSVHIVFAQYVQGIQSELSLSRNSLRAWPRILHRRLYYSLIMALERRLYTSSGVPLFLIAKRTATELERFYGRKDKLFGFYVGLDHETFNLPRRRALREEARRLIGLTPDRFALLLVGNDWHNKGAGVLLEALSQLRGRPIDLLLVSRENPSPHLAAIRDAGLEGRVLFLPPREDVEFYYAAADAYVGPSLEDTFALPAQEAMACGMPVIVSANNGTSEIITHGQDGLILRDPTDVNALVKMILQIVDDPALRARLGERAGETARQFTWERNAHDLTALFQEILRQKQSSAAPTLAPESGPGGIAGHK
ncbi:MAG: glycosyltransferase family 4 protein [Candidatus Acidiferrales bacterium]